MGDSRRISRCSGSAWGSDSVEVALIGEHTTVLQHSAQVTAMLNRSLGCPLLYFVSCGGVSRADSLRSLLHPVILCCRAGFGTTTATYVVHVFRCCLTRYFRMVLRQVRLLAHGKSG